MKHKTSYTEEEEEEEEEEEDFTLMLWTHSRPTYYPAAAKNPLTPAKYHETAHGKQRSATKIQRSSKRSGPLLDRVWTAHAVCQIFTRCGQRCGLDRTADRAVWTAIAVRGAHRCSCSGGACSAGSCPPERWSSPLSGTARGRNPAPPLETCRCYSGRREGTPS